jgi:hypothetical protein
MSQPRHLALRVSAFQVAHDVRLERRAGTPERRRNDAPARDERREAEGLSTESMATLGGSTKDRSVEHSEADSPLLEAEGPQL